MKRYTFALFILAVVSLACVLEPTANLSADVSTETAIPSPIQTNQDRPALTPTPIYCAVTAAEALHMRDAPNVKGIVIAWLSSGDQLTLLPDPPSGVWVKVTTAGNVTGWVNSIFTNCEVTK